METIRIGYIIDRCLTSDDVEKITGETPIKKRWRIWTDDLYFV